MDLKGALAMMGSKGSSDAGSADDQEEEGLSADELIQEGIDDFNEALKAETDKKRQAAIQAVIDQATSLLGE